MTTLRNRTPHAVDICDASGRRLARIEPDGPPARVEMCTIETGRHVDVAGRAVPVVETRTGAPIDLPAPEPGTVYIVSRLVAEISGRPDLVFPHDLVRDERGAVTGCRAFASLAPTAFPSQTLNAEEAL